MRRALEYSGSTYTFGEIDARSNRLAQSPSQPGHWPKVTDCVCDLANSVEMIDLLLACLKAGVILCRSIFSIATGKSPHILRDAELQRAGVAEGSPVEAGGLTVWDASGICCAEAECLARTCVFTVQCARKETLRPALFILPALPARRKARF